VATQYAPASPAAAHLQSIAYSTRLTPAAPSAMINHYRQAAARSGQWHRNWSRGYTLCSENSQPKWPGDLDLWLESGVQVTCDLDYLCQFWSS